MLVCYEARIDRVFDTCNSSLLKKYSLSTDLLATDNWRDQMNTDGHSTTQIFAQHLIEEGYAGLLVRSYAAGATEHDRNLVLWCWANNDSASLQVIDDENRLTYRLD